MVAEVARRGDSKPAQALLAGELQHGLVVCFGSRSIRVFRIDPTGTTPAIVAIPYVSSEIGTGPTVASCHRSN